MALRNALTGPARLDTPESRARTRAGEAPYPSKALAVLDIHRRDRLLEVVASAAQELLRSGDLAVSLQKVIERLGQATDADRAHIFLIQATGEKGRIVDHYVWAAPGVPTPPGFKDAKGLMADIGLHSWVPRLERGETIVGNVRDFEPAARALFERGGVKSALTTAAASASGRARRLMPSRPLPNSSAPRSPARRT